MIVYTYTIEVIFLKIIICDDKEEDVINIKKLLNTFMNKTHIDLEIFTSLFPEKVSTNFYDLAFIDIEMPGLNGLKLSEKLKKSNPNILIIIVTSFQSYLDDAMRIHVFRYLSKPIDKNRFYTCIKDAIKEYYSINKSITISSNDEFYVIKTNDILYIETYKNGCCIHTKRQDITTHNKLGDLYNMINQQDQFIYSHNSILINLQNVVKFNKNTVFLKKGENESISTYISQRKYSSFKKAFFDYIGGTQ